MDLNWTLPKLKIPQNKDLYDLFLKKGQGHQGIFSFEKGTLWENCKFLPEYFKAHAIAKCFLCEVFGLVQ